MECKGCGVCCSNLLPISKREEQTIERYIKSHNIKEQKNLVAVDDWNCPFMDLSKSKDRCLIYEVRPFICRNYTCEKYENKTPFTAEEMEIAKAEIRKPVFMRERFYENKRGENTDKS